MVYRPKLAVVRLVLRRQDDERKFCVVEHGGQGAHVFDVQGFQAPGDALRQALVLEKIAVGQCRGGKASRTDACHRGRGGPVAA